MTASRGEDDWIAVETQPENNQLALGVCRAIVLAALKVKD